MALLRAEAGRDPYDRTLSDLIGELHAQRGLPHPLGRAQRWFHRSGTKHFHHALVGDLTLTYEARELPADPGQRIFVYTAEPDSPSHEALNLIASWTATPAEASSAHADQA